MEPLSLNLAIIFGTRLFLGNFLDVFIPWAMNKRKRAAETADTSEDTKMTPAEDDYILMQYVSILESIKNYADIAIQFGFTMLFVAALPIACGASLMSNYAKVKFTAWKLFKFYQRPIPTSAQDIGTWQSIFTIISVVAVLTNGAIICFTMDVLDHFSPHGKVWIFLGFQWTLIFLQFVAQLWVDDVPEEVEIQMERNAFIKSVIIDHVADEDYFDDKAARLIEAAEGKAVQKDVTVAVGCCGSSGEQEAKVKKMAGTEGLTDLPEYAYPWDTVASEFPKAYATGGNLPAPPGDAPAGALPPSSLSGAGVMPPPPPAYN
jgi:anoctamin-10/anoctamin-7